MIRVKADTYKGVDFIDIREVYIDKKTGEMRFTKKGVAIKPDQLKDLIKALQNV